MFTGEPVSRLVQPRELMPSRNVVDAIVSRDVYGGDERPSPKNGTDGMRRDRKRTNRRPDRYSQREGDQIISRV